MKEGKRPVLLVIRDGWGANHNHSHDAFNAIKRAHTPVSDKLTAHWPRTELAACGLDVGVPPGVMGNSEVGHQNIGAGRIVDQEVVRITKAFETGTIRDNQTLKAAFDRARAGENCIYWGLYPTRAFTAYWSTSMDYWQRPKRLESRKPISMLSPMGGTPLPPAV